MLRPDALSRHQRAPGSRRETAYELLVAAVALREYREMDDEAVAALVSGQGTFADLRSMWRDRPQIRSLDYWRL